MKLPDAFYFRAASDQFFLQITGLREDVGQSLAPLQCVQVGFEPCQRLPVHGIGIEDDEHLRIGFQTAQDFFYGYLPKVENLHSGLYIQDFSQQNLFRSAFDIPACRHAVIQCHHLTGRHLPIRLPTDNDLSGQQKAGLDNPAAILRLCLPMEYFGQPETLSVLPPPLFQVALPSPGNEDQQKTIT